MIAVPVNVSWRNTSSSEYGTRPSRMSADFAPASSASKHASTFGIIPPSMTPEAISSRASALGEMRDERVGVRAVAEDAGRVGEEDRLLGLQRPATAAAAVSALTFSQLPVGVERQRRDDRHAPVVRVMPFSSWYSTRVTVPTRPRSIGLAVRARQASAARRSGFDIRLNRRPSPPSSRSRLGPSSALISFEDADDDVERRVVGVAAAGDFFGVRPASAIARSIGLPPPWTSTTGRRGG